MEKTNVVKNVVDEEEDIVASEADTSEADTSASEAGEESEAASEADASEAEDEDEADASEAEDDVAEASEGEDEEASEAEASASEAEEDEEASASEAEASASEAEESEEEGVEGAEPLSKKRKATAAVARNKTNISDIAGIPTAKKDKTKKKTKAPPPTFEDENEDEEEDEFYLQKFDKELRENFIMEHHPEAKAHNYEEVKALARVSRDGNGIITDPFHKTVPFLTKYEKTRILGQRAKQIDNGAKPFVKVPPNVIDGYHVALLELEQKKIPFIIKRPFPNGGIEYWHVSDLEMLD